jgi:hypothetical protein
MDRRVLEVIDRQRGGETRSVFIRRAVIAAATGRGARLDDRLAVAPDPVKIRHRGKRRVEAGDASRDDASVRQAMTMIEKLLLGRLQIH